MHTHTRIHTVLFNHKTYSHLHIHCSLGEQFGTNIESKVHLLSQLLVRTNFAYYTICRQKQKKICIHFFWGLVLWVLSCSVITSYSLSFSVFMVGKLQFLILFQYLLVRFQLLSVYLIIASYDILHVLSHFMEFYQQLL